MIQYKGVSNRGLGENKCFVGGKSVFMNYHILNYKFKKNRNSIVNHVVFWVTPEKELKVLFDKGKDNLDDNITNNF